MKRNLFALLVMLMTVVLAVSVSAATEIGTADELAALMGTTDATTLAGDYVLTADIDLSDVTSQKPIGSKDAPFTGTFDGDGHTVSGINLVDTSTGYWGFFGKVSGATIKNLTIDGYVESSKYFVGGLVGVAGDESNSTTLIENCVNYCTVEQNTNSATAIAGGIVGLLRGSDCSNVKITVKDCINYGDITAVKQPAGIVGRIAETADSEGCTYTITGCWNYGTVATNNNHDTAAGILGVAYVYNSTTVVENCYNDASAAISSGYQTAGIVGVAYTYAASASVTVRNCVNMGSITATYDNTKTSAGGIVGSVGVSAGSAKGKTTIENCFNGGDVSIASDYASQAGMILGDFYTAAAVDYATGNCYDADADITSGANTLVTTKVTDVTDADQLPESFDGVFALTADGPVPANAPHDCAISLDGGKCVCARCGEELLTVANGYILLQTAEDVLLLMANANNADALGYSYKLTTNIDLAEVDDQCPIGDIATPFVGTFDGAGYTIEGIAIETAAKYTGFFGVLAGNATVRDLTLDGTITDVTATSDTNYGVGGLAGGAGFTAGTVLIENCVNYVDVTGPNKNPGRAGGIVGLVAAGDGDTAVAGVNVTIRNCTNYGTIKSLKHTGGIVGRLADVSHVTASKIQDTSGTKNKANGTYKISECVNHGTIETRNTSGDGSAGIVAVILIKNSEFIIEKCVNTAEASVKAGYRLGGIVGSVITYSNTNGNRGTIDACVNLAPVTCKGSNYGEVGGIVGTAFGGDAGSMITIRNCFSGGTVTTGGDTEVCGIILGKDAYSATEYAAFYKDQDNYYSDAFTASNFDGNFDGGEAIAAAQWCMEHGFVYADTSETERTHLWSDDSAEATCIICSVTRHAKHAGAMKQVSEDATCISVSLSYDLCETCYLRENVVEGTELDPDDHALAWDVSGDTAVLACARCTHTADLSAVDGIYVSDDGDDSADGLSADTALKSYTLAQEIAAKFGKDVTVYLVGTVTLENRTYSANNTISKNFEEYPHTNTITVTSADAGDKATLVIPYSVTYYFLYGPTVFENIKLTGTTAGTASGGGSVRFYARGFDLTFGEGMEMVDIEGKLTYKGSNGTFDLSNTVDISDVKVYVNGGFQNNGLYEGVTNTTIHQNRSTNLKVLSGSYYAIVGGNYSDKTSAYPVDLENMDIEVTIGNIIARYVAPFVLNGTVTVHDSVADVHLVGKLSAAYAYRVVYDANGSGSGNTVNYFIHKAAAGSAVGEFPMASKTAAAEFNCYYATGLENDELVNVLYAKSVYYWNEYPTQGEKLNFVEWCAKYGAHDFVDGVCSFCDVQECTGSNHYIAWEDDGTGKCIAGCDHTESIADYSGIYVSDSGKDGADGKTASTPIRSYTLAQKLAAKAGKKFTVYLVGTVTLELNKTSEMNTVYKSFEEEKHTNSITVTKGGSAKPTLVIPYSVRNYFLSGPTTFTNIKISGDTVGTESGGGNVRIFARGNNITLGTGLEMVNIAGGEAITVAKTDAGITGFGATVEIPNSKVYVYGGFLHAEGQDGLADGGESRDAFSAYMSIQSGKYWAVCGGSYSDSTSTNPVVLDGATIRIGMSAFTARYLAPVNLNGVCTIDNTTVDIHYKGTANIAQAYRFIYSDLATGSGNTVNHFFYKGMKESEIGDFSAGSYKNTVTVNLYYATALESNGIIQGFKEKGGIYAEAYGQTGEIMTFPEWCVEHGGGHDYVDGVCSFCEIKPCSVHAAAWEVMTEATCTAEGLEAYRCKVCYEHVEEDRVIPVDENAHDAAWIYGETEATYTCSLCDDVLNTVTYASLAASGEVHVSSAGLVSGDGSAENPVGDFALAMQIAAAAETDVTVYIHDVATIYENGAAATLNDYVEPAHTNTITITSYGDTRAVLRFDDIVFRAMSYNLSGPTVFENIEFSAWSNEKVLYLAARHNPLVLGEGITIDYQRRGSNASVSAIYVIGGCYGTSNSADCGDAGADVTIKSGNYSYVYGGTYAGNCCSTGTIHLNLLGDFTVRNAFVTGNYGNNTYNGNSGDIHITLAGNVTVGTYFAFSSAGNNTKDAANPIAYSSKNVTIKVYSGSLITESFMRTVGTKPLRVLGAVAEGDTSVDRLEMLTIYVDPTSYSAKAFLSHIKAALLSPVADEMTEEDTEEEEDGETEEEGDGTGADIGTGTGETRIADPAKYVFKWLDDSYCAESLNGEHTPDGAAIEHLDPTCIAEGYDLYHCSNCGKDYSISIDMVEHTFGEATAIPATCVAPEMEKKTCSVCDMVHYAVVGDTFADHIDPDKTGVCRNCNQDLTLLCDGHKYTTETISTGCGTGEKNTCTKCGKVVVDVISDGHSYGKYTVTVEATDTTPGIKTRTCKGCGKVETALLYAEDSLNAEAIATDASGDLADFAVATSKLTKGEKAALNALLQQDAYGSEIKISYETDGSAVTGITYSIPVPAEYTEYENVRVVVKDDDGVIHFVDFKIEKGYIVFTF